MGKKNMVRVLIQSEDSGIYEDETYGLFIFCGCPCTSLRNRQGHLRATWMKKNIGLFTTAGRIPDFFLGDSLLALVYNQALPPHPPLSSPYPARPSHPFLMSSVIGPGKFAIFLNNAEFLPGFLFYFPRLLELCRGIEENLWTIPPSYSKFNISSQAIECGEEIMLGTGITMLDEHSVHT